MEFLQPNGCKPAKGYANGVVVQGRMVFLGGADRLVRLTWYITDRDAYLNSQKEMGAVYREVIGRHFSPMAVVQVVKLVKERALIEIEATAVLPN